MVTTTGMGEGALYRTATPINPKNNRNKYADAALKSAGIRTVINLADSRETAEGYDGYSESYGSASDQAAAAEASLYRTVRSLLYGEKDDYGTPLLYRGVYG